MIWVTTQPDSIEFIWETLVQERNFIEHDIDLSTVYCVFGIKDLPSKPLNDLIQRTKINIVLYQDEVINRVYAPSIQPYLLKKFYAEYKPGYVFHIDSDVIINKLPPFTGMMDGDWHVSDASSYLDYAYIQQFPEFVEYIEQTFGLTREWLIENERKCGGFGGPNYLMCNINESFFEEVEELSSVLYEKFMDARGIGGIDKRPLNASKDPIQIWTAGMWAWTWVAWKHNIKTYITPELSFCMADKLKNTYEEYFFHNTGGNPVLFNKRDYAHKYPFHSDNQTVGEEYAQNHYLKYINEITWELDNDISYVVGKALDIDSIKTWWIIEGDKEPTVEEKQYLRNIKDYKFPVHWNGFVIKRKLYGFDNSHL